jgi:hypothetical protein
MPEVQRQLTRDNLQREQRRFLHAAHKVPVETKGDEKKR